MEHERMSKIGIYDSGCGGLSVVNQILSKGSYCNMFYYADSLNNPWGNKPKNNLHKILLTIANWFQKMDIDG